MLRQQFTDALKAAMLAKESATVSSIRMITAALKDRDIAARPKGLTDGIGDEEILAMLQSMIKQRRESITLYTQGGRQDLVDKEQAEIEVIERFLPAQMNEAETAQAIKDAIAETGAASIKDMGKVMAVLKDRYTGRLDFGRAGPLVKAALG
jgi:uncharacterized protein YqeY